MGGGIQKRIYLVEHPQVLDASQKRQRIAQDAGGYINHPDPQHWMRHDSTNSLIVGGGKKTRSSYTDIPHLQTMDVNKQQLAEETAVCGASKRQGFHPAPLLTA